MIVTTTQSIEGRQIVEYRGIVFGEVITGINVLKDFAAGVRNFFGGRSAAYEEELNRVIVHSLLHLIGYKDKTDEDAAEMRSNENHCLELLKTL